MVRGLSLAMQFMTSVSRLAKQSGGKVTLDAFNLPRSDCYVGNHPALSGAAFALE